MTTKLGLLNKTMHVNFWINAFRKSHRKLLNMFFIFFMFFLFPFHHLKFNKKWNKTSVQQVLWYFENHLWCFKLTFIKDVSQTKNCKLNFEPTFISTNSFTATPCFHNPTSKVKKKNSANFKLLRKSYR